MKFFRKLLALRYVYSELRELNKQRPVIRERLKEIARADPVVGKFIKRIEDLIDEVEDIF